MIIHRDKNTHKPADGGLKYPELAEGALMIWVEHTGASPEQNFSGGLIEAGVTEGWVSITKGKLILNVKPEDLVYTIKRGPGRYCCHCGGKLADDATGEMARAHVAAEHKGEKSPDQANPGGYCMLNHYECVLDEAQHAKYRVKRMGGR